MNSKIAKLIRKWCKHYNRDYKLVKKVYKNLPKEEQEPFINAMKQSL